MSANRVCVIVSPYFPPSMLAGVHRARHLVKHLPAAGWTPIVLCVDEAHHEERLDPGLAKLVPSTAEVVKVPALSPRLTRLIGLGEISLRGFIPLRKKLFRLLQTRPISLVLITGSPYYPMLLASEIKRRVGVPVVLDFQDPWVTAWGAAQPRLSKSGLSHALATALEPKVLRSASFITSVSEIQNRLLVKRYPWLDCRCMDAIPIGGDPEDFGAVLAQQKNDPLIRFNSDHFHISYVGTIWPAAEAIVRLIMRGLAALRVKDKRLYDRIRLNFVGTSANPNGTQSYRVLPIARAEGVADSVYEIPQRIPYLEALSILLQSDAVMMLGSDEPHYTASKIYPYLMSGRPHLSIFHRASSAHEILSTAGGGVVLGFSNDDRLASIEADICQALARIAMLPGSLGKPNSAAYSQFEARIVAQRFASIFEKVCA